MVLGWRLDTNKALPACLPACLPAYLHLIAHRRVQVPVLYYLVLVGVWAYTGTTWSQLLGRLAHGGWITMPAVAKGREQFWEVYKLYDLFPEAGGPAVQWGALLRQIPMALALFSVVLFGSCLDITAIQASLPYEVQCLFWCTARVHRHL
jgi:MFS superfamily sulfate permease-like transporter